MRRNDPVHHQLGASPPSPRAPWHRGRGIELLAVVFFLALGVYFISRSGSKSEWHEAYTTAARHMLDREAIHRPPPDSYSYPPLMALLATPIARMSPTGSLAIWYLINVGATCALFGSCLRMTGAPPRTRLAPFWRSVFWLSMLLAFHLVTIPFTHQQTDMVIAALVMAGCERLSRGHDTSAGALLGAAAAMKCTPLLFAPYLLWRGKPRAAVLLVAVALGLNLLPDLVMHQTAGGSYLVDWVHMFLSSVAKSTPGTWSSDLMQNQSLAGLFNRLLRYRHSLSLSDQSLDLPSSIKSAVRLLTYGTGLALLAITAHRFGRPFRPLAIVSRRTSAPPAWDQLRMPCEAAAILCLMLLLSPMTSKGHYVVLLLPAMIFSRLVLERPTRSSIGLFVLLLACGPLSTKGLIGKSLGDLALACGVPMWYAVLMLIAMWRAVGRCQAAASPLPNLRAALSVEPLCQRENRQCLAARIEQTEPLADAGDGATSPGGALSSGSLFATARLP